MKFINARDQKPSIEDCDWLGYVLCRIRKGRNWMFADLRIDDPAMVDHGWQWLAGATDFEDSENKHDATK
jgi:hypothetical protein